MYQRMPKMNGQTATRLIRQMGFQGIIIGATGDFMDQEIEQFKQSGVDAVLAKPLDLKVFRETLLNIQTQRHSGS